MKSLKLSFGLFTLALVCTSSPLAAGLDNLYHYFYDKDKVPAKLEPGNASYELAYSSIGIIDYLQKLAERVGAQSPLRNQITTAFSQITLHENDIAERLLAYLRSRNDCRIIGISNGQDPSRVPTISFVIEDQNAGELAKKNDAYKIAVRFGDFHARRLIEYLELTENGGCLRVSRAHYNTLDELDALIAAIHGVTR